ncbi:MAG TPA: hypothetical protein VFL13_16290, partial [Candidatus Baltobacteraceae bacterium]|nr:hypothetical protein [Candidatus Baltobacteraceae bacterium]
GTTSAKTPSTNDVYCATSDGTGTFIFTEIGSAGTAAANPCAASPAPTPMPGGNVFDMSAWSFVEGNPMQSNPGPASGYCQTAIFNMAASGPGQLVEIPNAGTTGWFSDFYLWKATMVDIARGMALQDVLHPASTWNTATGPAFSSYFKDPVFDQWAYILHKDMYANKAYALQYDELGGLSTSFTPDVSGRTTLDITVQQIPTGGPTALPSPAATAPWPVPPPLPCPTPTPAP